ncbi:MAG: DUF2079 domain-containing protein [Candidatus Micrarchaeaceae archaeon]
MNLKLIKSLLISMKQHIIINIIFAVFATLWAYISVLRVYALSYTVSSIGMLMQEGSNFLNAPISFQNLIMHPIIFLIFPLFMFKSYVLIVVFQELFITIAVFPLYGIAMHILKKKHLALMISVAYLIYPYIAGLYWFNFLYASLFPTLFLIGYYLYLKSKFKSAFVIFLVSGLTVFPYMMFIILLSAILIIESMYHKKYIYESFEYVKFRFSMYLIIISTAIFLIMNYAYMHNTALGALSMYAPYTKYSQFPFSNIDYKVNVILVLLVPLLALPIISKRFFILYIPYFYVLFDLSYPITPSFLSYEFASLLVPFLFLGFIDALNDLVEDEPVTAKTVEEKVKSTVSDPKFKFTALMLILVILFASVYLPIGPFNQYSGANFEFTQNTTANYTAYNELSHIISMVPSNDPYVLTQNNIPELYPRPIAYGVPMIAGISKFTNLTAHGQYLNVNGKNISARIDYIVADLNSPWYLAGVPNMYNFTSVLYGSGQYGIVAEASGFVLLERNYTGGIDYYVPAYYSFNPSSLILGPNSTLHKNMVLANNTNNMMLWKTHLFNLAPGNYNITLSIKTNNTISSNQLAFNLTAYSVPMLTQYNISGIYLRSQSLWTNISFSVTVSNFYANVTLSCYSVHWNGSLEFKNIALIQNSEPPTYYKPALFIVVDRAAVPTYTQSFISVTKMKDCFRKLI